MVAGYDALSAPMKCAYYVLGGAVFLGIPHTYFRRIQDVDRTRFRDGVNTMRWKAFLRALLKEWGDSNLLVRPTEARARARLLIWPAGDRVDLVRGLLVREVF